MKNPYPQKSNQCATSQVIAPYLALTYRKEVHGLPHQERQKIYKDNDD
jgi:hypothetical protein